MSSTFTNAWGWSLKHSPLLSIWRSARGMIRPNRDAFALLERASLPKAVDEIIRETVERTKLWRDEREQIARELITHAQDALDAGRDPAQVVGAFGDPRKVAGLLRRSMKRKRPMSWQLYRLSRRAAATVLILLIVGYSSLAVRFYSGAPSIDTDYFALLDSRDRHYAPEQRSWPVIAEVGHTWDRASYRLSKEYSAFGAYPNLGPDDEGYEDVAETVRAIEGDLQRLRQAAQLPVIGAPRGYELEQVHEEGISWTVGIVPADQDSFRQHTLYEALLPQLSWTRRLSILLAFDARLAVGEGDTDRAFQDLIAIAHLARQSANEPYIISALISMAIDSMFADEIARILRTNPDAFSEEQLVELAHANALTSNTSLNLLTERMIFDDILQRAYTDDGHGNGRMTAEGADLLAGLESLFWREANQTNTSYRLVESAALPSMLLLMNDRAEERSIYNSVIDRNEQVLAEGPQAIGWMEYEEQLLAWRASRRIPVFSAAEAVTPAMGQAVQSLFQHRMVEQAASTMLAIEVYRTRHGELPDSLDQLPVSLLPQQPQDAFAPGSTLRFIQGEHGGYVLYSIGADGNDDSGLSPASDLGKERDLRLRFPFRITQNHEGKPVIDMVGGQPRIGSPRGPDGDWVLIDTRPERDGAAEP